MPIDFSFEAIEFRKGAIKEGPGILMSNVMYRAASPPGTMGGLSVINGGVSTDNLTGGQLGGIDRGQEAMNGGAAGETDLRGHKKRKLPESFCTRWQSKGYLLCSISLSNSNQNKL